MEDFIWHSKYQKASMENQHIKARGWKHLNKLPLRGKTVEAHSLPMDLHLITDHTAIFDCFMVRVLWSGSAVFTDCLTGNYSA